MFVRSMLMLSLVLGVGAARAQAQEGAPPPAPYAVELPPPAVEVAPPQPPPQGQWVNTAEYGWVWIPYDAMPQAVGGVPYAYLYTPALGWTWYASPWGWGRFAIGGWVTRPAPYGYRAWVRGPRGWGWYHGPRAGVRYVVPHVHAPPARWGRHAHVHHGHGGPRHVVPSAPRGYPSRGYVAPRQIVPMRPRGPLPHVHGGMRSGPRAYAPPARHGGSSYRGGGHRGRR